MSDCPTQNSQAILALGIESLIQGRALELALQNRVQLNNLEEEDFRSMELGRVGGYHPVLSAHEEEVDDSTDDVDCQRKTSQLLVIQYQIAHEEGADWQVAE